MPSLPLPPRPRVAQRLLRAVLIGCQTLVRAVANRLLDARWTHARPFSNALLRAYAPLFRGRVINVSGWTDEDREGRTYREYFTQASAYVVSNAPIKAKGLGSVRQPGVEELALDLLQPLADSLQGQFDVVFNHTTLEHLPDPLTAFRNLCQLSRDAVILVVPAMQQLHHGADFGDYWRLTPFAVAHLFLRNGLEPMVVVCNDQPFAPIYCFAIGVRHPERYVGRLPRYLDFSLGRYNYGSSLKPEVLEAMLRSSRSPER